MSVTRLCEQCGGRRAPDCPHDLPRMREPLTLDDVLKPSPLERRLKLMIDMAETFYTTRLTDCLAAERAGQLRLW